jgi:DNA-binding transcriptional MerR regulator
MSQTKLIPDHLKDVGFLSKKAGSFSGVPQRTVQLWTEKGLIKPEIADSTGTGNRRLYSVYNCIEIALIRSISESGLSYRIIRQIMEFLYKKSITKRQKDGSFGGGVEEWEVYPADRSNFKKLINEDSAKITIYLLDDGKISFFASGFSATSGHKLGPDVIIETAHIIPQEHEGSYSGEDCDKTLTLNLSRIARKTIGKMG